MLNIRTLALALTLLISQASWALVDYSEQVYTPPPKSSFSKKKRAVTRTKKVARSERKVAPAQSRSAGSMGNLQLKTRYDSTSFQSESESGKVNRISVNGHFQTNYDLYLDFSYWMAKSDSEYLAESASHQKGNPKVILGFNWMKFGSAADGTNIDLYVGGQLGEKDSAFATSRTDKIFGVETTKRFYSFVLGFAYEMTLTGTPDNTEEMDIGSIQKISAGLGWLVSPDISISVEAENYTINEGDQGAGTAYLNEKLSFSTITPTLQLGVGPSIMLELGARFNSKKVQQRDSLVSAKLWNQAGLYGNSIFTGLGVSW